MANDAKIIRLGRGLTVTIVLLFVTYSVKF